MRERPRAILGAASPPSFPDSAENTKRHAFPHAGTPLAVARDYHSNNFRYPLVKMGD